MSFDLSNTRNTNVWRESLNREFNSRRENKNAPLSIKEVSARAMAISDLTKQQKQQKQALKSLKNSKDYSSLFYGLSHEGNGRKAYLQTRNGKSPHERNDNKVVTSSQEIGFQAAKERPKLPDHGNKCLIKKEFYTRGNGVF